MHFFFPITFCFSGIHGVSRCKKTGSLYLCCDFENEQVGDVDEMMICQSNGKSTLDLDHSSSAAAGGHKNYPPAPVTVPPPLPSVALASGWMYVNQRGQMCGPYIQQQLYEGLSSGFSQTCSPELPMLGEPPRLRSTVSEKQRFVPVLIP